MQSEATIRELHSFVIDKAQDELPRTRARLFRALARLSGTDTEAQRLQVLAMQCEQLDADHAQLVLDFKRRARG